MHEILNDYLSNPYWKDALVRFGIVFVAALAILWEDPR